uniref:Uncharacterized protein n=1 Tax=Rhizophora mucronata TaxID=61149 RepID=A0A2P2NSA5_RHIMU
MLSQVKLGLEPKLTVIKFLLG